MESIHADYLSFFSLQHPPFEENRDPRFYYQSGDHQEALERLHYIVSDGNMNIGVLTGEVGCGKTLTRLMLQKQLDKKEYEVCALENSFYPFDDLLYEMLVQARRASRDSFFPEEADLPDRGDRYALMKALKATLDTVRAGEGRRYVLILDESQHLGGEELDELKNLTNLSRGSDNLITILLIGQPELSEIIHGLKQVEQRVSLRYHINNFDLENTRKYLCHRLKVAGHPSGNIVTIEAVELLFRHSLGVPREINRVCKLALEQAFTMESPEITRELLADVLEDITGESIT